MKSDLFIGIDGCKKGWIYAAVGSKNVYRIGFEADIRNLWDKAKRASLTLIDIPIGLSFEGPRSCDLEARKFLKPKSGSCVFPPPCREACLAKSYEKACSVNKKTLGTKISKQAWGIAPKIREVDEFLRSTPEATGKVRESHPEVCFAALAGQPVVSSKKEAAGMSERLEILKRYLGDIDSKILYAFIANRKNGAALDDILDALAVAVTARYASGNPLTLPQSPKKDLEGLPMEIVYFKCDSILDQNNL
jgi:predicted RNase H-like nuclease